MMSKAGAAFTFGYLVLVLVTTFALYKYRVIQQQLVAQVTVNCQAMSALSDWVTTLAVVDKYRIKRADLATAADNVYLTHLLKLSEASRCAELK